MAIKLGAQYKDKITGFSGTATGYCEYITGCNQALLVSTVSKDHPGGTSKWVDEQRLDQVGKNVVKINNGNTPGADITPPGDDATDEETPPEG